MPYTPSDLPPQPRPGILEIAPYQGGKSSVAGVSNVVKLSSNESPLGPSPKSLEAALEATQRMELYPDGGATKLREAIAQVYELDASRIICGNGSDNLLELLIRAFVGPGDEVVYSAHGFLMYKIYTLSVGGTAVPAAETDLTANVDALLAAVTPRTKMVFIANPNNPTGTYIPASEVERLRAGLPKSVVLVLDCAYAEYMEEADYTDGFDMTNSVDENVVVTRTFSKIYGLGGMRLGWAYCPANIADLLNRLRSPFNVAAPALAAGEVAVLDTAYLDGVRAHNATWRHYTFEALTGLGLTVTPGFGNFLLIHFNSPDQAQAADQALQQAGYILRAVGSYGLPNCLRMTIGTEQDCRGVVATLDAFLKDQP